jgi:rhamnose utilization protein RhaD (predicted bifunctional aldolase and dehydrogenase)
VLDFLARASHPALAALGTSCPDHFLRTKVRPMLLDLPPDASYQAAAGRLRELHQAYREDYRAYYERYADAASPPMRGADPAVVLVPGVGMFSFGADGQTARVAGEFYLNAINVMRGAEAVSAYQPIPESEKFRTGNSRRPSCGAAFKGPSRSRWPGASRWSPGAVPASAGPPLSGSPPRAPAWS